MNNRGEAVYARFFEAIEFLHATYSIPEMCEVMQIRKDNFCRKRRGERGKDKLPIEWLTAIVEKYRVSAEWLLVGKGNMFK